MVNKAVFLDRDGTINVDYGYVSRWDRFEFIEGAIEALHRLKNDGYLLIIITNQSGIARGYFNEEDVVNLHQKMNEYLYEQYGFKIDKFYYCPHHEDGVVDKYKKKCRCRKPEKELLEKAKNDFQIDLSKSYMIGDKETDNISEKELQFIKVDDLNTIVQVIDRIIRNT